MKSGIFKDYSAQDWLTPPVIIISSLGRQKKVRKYDINIVFQNDGLTVVTPQCGEEWKA